jgi:tape measure domain-containing protein
VADGYKFPFEVEDKASRALNAIASSLNRVDRTLVEASAGIRSFESGLGGVLKGMEGAGVLGFTMGSLISSGIQSAISSAVQLGQTVAGWAFDSEKFGINMLAFKESTLASWKNMLGSEAAAKEMFQSAAKMGALTPFETQDVVKSYSQLLSAGFRKEDVPVLYQGLADVGASSGFDAGVMERITLQLGQMKSIGKFQWEDFRVVIQAASKAGVSAEKVFEKIGATMGIAAGEVGKAMSAGKVSADVGILGFFQALQDASGGHLGQKMLDQAKTLKGMMSTLGSVFGDVFLNMDLDTSPAFKAVKGTLENVLGLFKEGSRTARLFGTAVENAFNAITGDVFGQFSGPEGAEKLLDFFLRGIRAVEGFAQAVRVGIGFVQGAFEGLFGPTSNLFDGPLSEEKLKAVIGQARALGVEFSLSLRTVAGAVKEVAEIVHNSMGLLAGTAQLGLKVASLFIGPQATADAMRWALPSGTLSGITAAGGGKPEGATVTIAPGAVQVDGRGHSPEAVGEAVHGGLLDALNEYVAYESGSYAPRRASGG